MTIPELTNDEVRAEVFATIKADWPGPKEFPQNLIDYPDRVKRRWFCHLMLKTTQLRDTYRLLDLPIHTHVADNIYNTAKRYLTQGPSLRDNYRM